MLTNLLCEYSVIVANLRRFGPSRKVSKSRLDERVCPMDDVFTTRAFPFGEVFADAMRSGRSSCVR